MPTRPSGSKQQSHQTAAAAMIRGAGLYTGDCVAVMVTMDAESIDAVVTDPPYGIAFMGKDWDRISHERWATEAFRVAKPGAHLLAFGGTRTYHRLASAIEDAGWEIRDCLVWAYASGFPKSLDVSKAIDKAAGEWRGRAGAVTIESQAAKGTEYERTPKGDPITAEAVRWAGWGTALKPAWEPIVMARKPLIGTVAANVAAHGTGALNIDGTRIPTSEAWDGGQTQDQGGVAYGGSLNEQRSPSNGNGRWPANLILTDPLFDGGVDGVVGGGTTTSGAFPGEGYQRAADSIYGPASTSGGARTLSDTGTYSRFFLIPKAARSDREPLERGAFDDFNRNVGNTVARRRANVHPTVKPIELMRHLVRLVTPPGGVVLDCFLGSGTTAIACEMEGFSWIGIEREPEYVKIAEARLVHVQKGLGL